jgi:amino acid transporter
MPKPARDAEQRKLMQGGKPGSEYVRIAVPTTQTFRWRGAEDDVLVGDEPQDSPSRLEAADRPIPPVATRTRVQAPEQDIVLPGIERRATVEGSQPGARYVRRYVPAAGEFRARGFDTTEATEAILAPRSTLGHATDRLRRLLIGRRLSTAEEIHERLTKVKALAVLSSDAISSVAYGTEASLGVLILAGASALRYNLPIAGAIVLLMIIVGFSYRQTIHAYPHGGGSYIVARDNLGDLPGLIAAAALLIDYVLTVSVSVSSGVDALTSAFGALHPYSVWLGLACIFLIMLGNLRGIRESGSIFAIPTYLFIVCFLIMISAGVIHAILSPGGLLTPIVPGKTPAQLGWESGQLGVVLILTAFSSGCVAMTGTEAISNGVPAFKKPESDNAARTLVWMVAILATFYAGTTYLAWRFGLEPNALQQPTIDSQIASLLFHGSFAWFYYVIQFATLLILVLAANTSYADFPRLSSILARDHYLPHQFAYRGNRLAFNTGILVLTLLSALLLVVFHGNTDALINLYALGVFTAFTLSQTGMVVRWRRLRDQAGPSWRRSMAINLLGAITTGVVAVIIIGTKFDRGAWIVVILVPVFVILLQAVSRHYAGIQQKLAVVSSLPVDALARANHVMIVPIAELNRPALRALAYAASLTPHVVAIHVVLGDENGAQFRAAWKDWIAGAQGRLDPPARPDGQPAAQQLDPHLVLIESPYRILVAPLVAYIDALCTANPEAAVSVILPEFVVAHWWEHLLHNQTALRLKLKLYSNPNVAVINIPYHVARSVER